MLEYLEVILFFNLFCFGFLVIYSICFFRKSFRMERELNALNVRVAVIDALQEERGFSKRNGNTTDRFNNAGRYIVKTTTEPVASEVKRRRPGRPPRKVEQKSP